MIVIRNKETRKYMGGLNRKTGNHVSCDDCVKAKKYTTKNQAIAAIGADSGNNHLPEPSKEKLLALINELQRFTTIHKKTNLGRILCTN